MATRCILLGALFLASFVFNGHIPLSAQTADVERVAVDADAAVRYVQSCRKSNGAFGPADQEYTDAAWNFPAVAALLLLHEKIERPEEVLAHGLGFPRGHAGYSHWQFFHEHQIRNVLGKPITPANAEIQVEHQGYEVRYYGSPWGTSNELLFKAGSGAEPAAHDIAAEKIGYYNLSSLYHTLAGLKASRRSPKNKKELVEFIQRRQAPNGGFVDLRTADATPLDAETHVASTFHAIAALDLLGEKTPRAADCAAFVRSCQLPSGAFRWNPNGSLPGNVADIYYTSVALRSLTLLGSAIPRGDECVQWINSLQNDDGGFGDQPGWRSRLYSTYYAVDALATLRRDARSAITKKSVGRSTFSPITDPRFRVYQSLFKMPVCGAADLEGLQRRGFNLLAFKSDKFDDALPLLPEIKERKLPMDVVLCPEMYPHRLRREGQMMLNHVGNFTLDPRWTKSQLAIWQAADSAGRQNLFWTDYHQQVIQPLQQSGTLCYPEQDFEMEYAYSAYDAGVTRQGGYNAVLAGFNWAPRDFIRVFPWRERYVDKLTPIADADAHGDLAKWSPQLDYVRHLYIAAGPSYADFLEAAAAKRVVCVVTEPESVASGVTYYGSAPAVEFVKQRVHEWQWWKK